MLLSSMLGIALSACSVGPRSFPTKEGDHAIDEVAGGIGGVLQAVDTARAGIDLESLADRLADDCRTLRVLDEAAYQAECEKRGTLALLRSVRAAIAGRAATGVADDTARATPTSDRIYSAEEAASLRTRVAVAPDAVADAVAILRSDVQATSERLGYAYLTTDRHALLEVEAALTAYRDMLRIAANDVKAVPDEPFALLDEGKRKKAHAMVQQTIYGLAEEQLTPRLHAELVLMKEYEQRLASTIGDDAPGTFHLARDSLDGEKLITELKKLDEDKARQKAILLHLHTETYGPLWSSPGPDFPDDDPTSRQGRVRESLRPMHERPVARLRAEALLQAEFDELRATGALPNDIDLLNWKVSHLDDRVRLIIRCELAEATVDASSHELRRMVSGPRAATKMATLRSFDSAVFPNRAEVEARYFVLAHAAYPHADSMPPGLRKDLRATVQTALSADFQASASLFDRLDQVQRRLAMLSEPLEPSQLAEMRAMRARAVEHARQIEAKFLAFESVGYQVDADMRRRVVAWRHLAGDADPPPPAALLTLFDGKTKVSRQALADTCDALESKVAGLDTKPPAYSSAKGRRIATEGDLSSSPINSRKFAVDDDLTRLPEEYKDYKGRVKTNGRYYDFDSEVRDFKSFKGVGGGIHMGTTAKFADPERLRGGVLRYNDSRQALEFVLPSGATHFVAWIDPVSLKALYRYVRSGANLGVSIGDSAARTRNERGQTVLLDPMLVDTPIGQNLVVTDKLPWDLGKPTLPNGKENPIAASFAASRAAEMSAFHEDTLVGWLEGTPDLGSGEWSAGRPLDEGLVIDVLFDRIVRYRDTRKAISELGSEVDARLAEALTSTGDWSDAAFALAEVSARNGRLVRKQVQLIHAMFLKQVPLLPPRSAAQWILAYSKAQALATLIDDEVVFDLGLAEPLKVKLHWYYARSSWTVESDVMRLDVDKDGDPIAHHLRSLEQIVNAALETLAARFPPLAAQHKYAGICALLRAAEQPAAPIGLDLSALARYKSSDPVRSPTPDAVEQ